MCVNTVFIYIYVLIYTGQLLIHLGGLMYIIQLTRDAVSAEESAVSLRLALCCNTLQHTAMYCNTLQRGICCECLRLALLQHTAIHCNTLQYTATRNLL